MKDILRFIKQVLYDDQCVVDFVDPFVTLGFYDFSSRRRKDNESALLNRYMQFVNKNSDTVSTDEFMRRQRQLRRKVNRGAPRLLFKLKSDDGFEIQSHSLQGWEKINRILINVPTISVLYTLFDIGQIIRKNLIQTILYIK